MNSSLDGVRNLNGLSGERIGGYKGMKEGSKFSFVPLSLPVSISIPLQAIQLVFRHCLNVIC